MTFDPKGDQLIRVVPMSGETGTPQLADWELPGIPIHSLERQNSDDVEPIED